MVTVFEMNNNSKIQSTDMTRLAANPFTILSRYVKMNVCAVAGGGDHELWVLLFYGTRKFRWPAPEMEPPTR